MLCYVTVVYAERMYIFGYVLAKKRWVGWFTETQLRLGLRKRLSFASLGTKTVLWLCG